jgi:hypothetical protein
VDKRPDALLPRPFQRFRRRCSRWLRRIENFKYLNATPRQNERRSGTYRLARYWYCCDNEADEAEAAYMPLSVAMGCHHVAKFD